MSTDVSTAAAGKQGLAPALRSFEAAKRAERDLDDNAIDVPECNWIE